MTDITQGEMVALAASICGVDLDSAAHALFIVGMKDGTVGIGSTGPCDCLALDMLGRAVERVATGFHTGESHDGSA